jgi:hypothetical protein
MNQIVAYDKINDAAGLEMFGNAICRSGMFGCESKEAGIVFALQCVAENKPPLEMAKNYHLVKGKLTKRADAMLADFRRAGGKVTWRDLKDEKVQAAVFEFEDVQTPASFSMEDAKRAGLVRSGSAWDKTPAAMLRARCISETLRAIAPEIVQGVYVPEELDVTNVEPKPVSQPKVNKPTQPVIDAEVVEPTKRPQLEALIGEDDLEYNVNLYWSNKGKIDMDLDQTWRDLPQSIQAKMEMDFDAFRKAITK